MSTAPTVFVAAGLALLGFGRRMLGPAARPRLGQSTLRRLSRVAVQIPLDGRGDAVAARCRLSPRPPSRPRPGVGRHERRVLISGVLFRTEANLSALCVTCPHEQCQVDLVTDEERLARMPRQRVVASALRMRMPFQRVRCRERRGAALGRDAARPLSLSHRWRS